MFLEALRAEGWKAHARSPAGAASATSKEATLPASVSSYISEIWAERQALRLVAAGWLGWHAALPRGPQGEPALQEGRGRGAGGRGR